MRFSDLLPTSIHQKTMINLERATLESKSTTGQITYSVAAVVTGVFSAFEKTLEVPLRVLPTLTVTFIRLFKKDEFYPSLTVTNIFKTAEAVYHQGRGVILTLISPLFGCTMNFEAQRTMGNYSSPRKSAAEIHIAAEQALKQAGESATKVDEAKKAADEAKTTAETAQTSATAAETTANAMKVEVKNFGKEVEDMAVRATRAFDNASEAKEEAAAANTEATAAKTLAEAHVVEIAALKKEIAKLKAIPQGADAMKIAAKDGMDYCREKAVNGGKFGWSILVNAGVKLNAHKEKIAKTEACKRAMEWAGYKREESVVKAQVVELRYDGTVVQPEPQTHVEVDDSIFDDLNIDPIDFTGTIRDSVTVLTGKAKNNWMYRNAFGVFLVSYFTAYYFHAE